MYTKSSCTACCCTKGWWSTTLKPPWRPASGPTLPSWYVDAAILRPLATAGAAPASHVRLVHRSLAPTPSPPRASPVALYALAHALVFVHGCDVVWVLGQVQESQQEVREVNDKLQAAFAEISARNADVRRLEQKAISLVRRACCLCGVGCVDCVLRPPPLPRPAMCNYYKTVTGGAPHQ